MIRQLAPLALAALLAVAVAEQAGQALELELGFNGEVVSGAWNPVRLTLRDVGRANLVLTIDQGSLRQGEVPVVYRDDIVGGTGLVVREDDVFVPIWRSFTWTVKTPDATLDSGAYAPRSQDGRPLDLILSRQPGRWRTAFGPEARTVEVVAGALSDRVAAYEGVRSLLIDGSAAAPRLRSVVAAATAGVTVVLIGPLPASHRELALLATPDGAGLGAGTVVLIEASGPSGSEVLEPLLEGLGADDDVLYEVLIEDAAVTGPAPVSQMVVLAAAAAYALVSLLLLRFGGLPGVLAGLSLAALLSFAAYGLLRPATARVTAQRNLLIGSGGLAKRISVLSVLTLPEGEVDLRERGVLGSTRSYRSDASGVRYHSERWHTEVLRLRPGLRQASLRWDGEALINDGTETLTQVFVQGLGPQEDLRPGQRIVPQPDDDRNLSMTYLRLVPHLSTGSALARTADTLHLALPPRPGSAEREPGALAASGSRP